MKTLNLLSHCKCKRHAQALLTVAPKRVIRLLSEVCLNLANNNIDLSPKQIKSLRKYKSTIKKLAGGNIESNRRLLVQTGGIIPILPTIAAAVLPSVASGLFDLGKKLYHKLTA